LASLSISLILLRVELYLEEYRYFLQEHRDNIFKYIQEFLIIDIFLTERKRAYLEIYINERKNTTFIHLFVEEGVNIFRCYTQGDRQSSKHEIYGKKVRK
jgi:hypothetical protein